MHEGKMNGYFCQGFNPLLSAPNRRKITTALSKLKFLVVMDPLQTETARFWENYGEHNDVDSSSIQTEVIELPTTCFAEETGSLVNSGRWLQWHWQGGNAARRGQARQLHHGADLPAPAGALSEGRRHGSRADRQSRLALQGPRRADARGACQGAQRLRQRRHHRSERSDQGRDRQGQAARQFFGAARRRQDDLRLLDLFRLLQRSGQQHGPSRQ